MIDGLCAHPAAMVLIVFAGSKKDTAEIPLHVPPESIDRRIGWILSGLRAPCVGSPWWTLYGDQFYGILGENSSNTKGTVFC